MHYNVSIKSIPCLVSCSFPQENPIPDYYAGRHMRQEMSRYAAKHQDTRIRCNFFDLPRHGSIKKKDVDVELRACCRQNGGGKYEGFTCTV